MTRDVLKKEDATNDVETCLPEPDLSDAVPYEVTSGDENPFGDIVGDKSDLPRAAPIPKQGPYVGPDEFATSELEGGKVISADDDVDLDAVDLEAPASKPPARKPASGKASGVGRRGKKKNAQNKGDEDADLVDDGDDGSTSCTEGLPPNDYLRPLGYHGTTNYYFSKSSNQVFGLTPAQYKNNYMLCLAPLKFWLALFPTTTTGRVNWEAAIDALITAAYEAGPWDPKNLCHKGARIDKGLVVFNTGSRLIVEDEGMTKLSSFVGKYTYCTSANEEIPNIVNPFTAESPELRQAVDIISSLDWREGNREIAILALLGYIALGPLCGMLPWRSHIMLDGPVGCGKTWVGTNLVSAILGEYKIHVQMNTSESGIRNVLDGNFVPCIFDEAEGEGVRHRMRVDDIIKLARACAMDSNAAIVQGVSGGGATRTNNVASMFFMSQVVPQLRKSADESRFAQLHMSSGLKYDEFREKVELPAKALFTPEFSARWIGRMVLRAPDYAHTIKPIVEALSREGLARRTVDVYSAFAAGCWLLLREGVPADADEAHAFIKDEFGALGQIRDVHDELQGDKDHDDIFRKFSAGRIRVQSTSHPAADYYIGSVLSAAAGNDEDATGLSQEVAQRELRLMGIRFADESGAAMEYGAETPVYVLIHKKSEAISAIFKNTDYETGYARVMSQASDVVAGQKPIRFGPTLGQSRVLQVPLSRFGIEVATN